MNKRTNLRRVIIDTPALLNLVKHCRESDSNAAQGMLVGVTQRKEGENLDSLLVTQTMPKANKAQMNDLMATIENESQKLVDTNEVGFYVNSRMGLCFTRELLLTLLEASKKFKNSVFIAYDTSKANFGLNPLHAYRLSDVGLASLYKMNGQAQPIVQQSDIIEKNLQI